VSVQNNTDIDKKLGYLQMKNIFLYLLISAFSQLSVAQDITEKNGNHQSSQLNTCKNLVGSNVWTRLLCPFMKDVQVKNASLI
jgi:hypothetical protein